MFRQQLRRRDRLYGLAEPHLVRNQATSGARGEQRTLSLVRVQLRLQQFLQRWARWAFGVGLVDRPPTVLSVTRLCDEGQRVLITPQFVSGFPGAGDESFKLGKAIGGKCSGRWAVKHGRSGFGQRRGTA